MLQSRFQLNAMLRAAYAAIDLTTIDGRGFLGIGLFQSTDYALNYYHSNAVFDSRGFTAQGSGGPSVPTLNASGLPTGSSTLCFNTVLNATIPGPLPAGVYYLNVPSAGQTVTASISSVSTPGIMTLGAGVPQGDGVTVRYQITLNAAIAGTAALEFSGALSDFPRIARNGAVDTTGQPFFDPTAVAFHAKHSCLRFMDFLTTNGIAREGRQDTTWSTRPGNWGMHAYAKPYSWEKLVAFIAAVANYPGSKFRNAFINIPGFADDDYVAQLATFINAAAPTVQMHVQRANEQWNSGFAFNGTYQGYGATELNYLTNYPAVFPAIASVTSDGTKLTFTTTSPIVAVGQNQGYLTTTASCVVTDTDGLIIIGTYGSPVVATKTGTSTFTIPSMATAVGNERVIFGGQPSITKVSSDGTKLTFKTAAPIGAYLTSTANCCVVGGVGGFSVGTTASPVVATKTGPDTFTVPTTFAYGGTGFMGVIFNLASSLVTDGALPDIFHVGNKWYVRRLYQDWQIWNAIRPQDRFYLDTGLYGGQGAGGNSSSLIEFGYAAYLGGGVASSWLYGSALGFYAKPTSTPSTVDALVTELTATINGAMDGYIRGHVYQCKLLGIQPMAYEGGYEAGERGNLVDPFMTDVRSGVLLTLLLDKWYSNGGGMFNYYHGSPQLDLTYAALKSYADVTSPKYAAILAYGAREVTYSNIFGSPGSVSLTTVYQRFGPNGQITNGLIGWFSASGYFMDVVVTLPDDGNYTFTVVGASKFANPIGLYIDTTLASDGTLMGTSTLTATGGGFGTDTNLTAVGVANPVSANLTAGAHILRLKPTTGGTGGAALLRVDIVKNP